VGRNVHHQVPQTQPPTPPPSIGVDYLGMVAAVPEEQLLSVGAHPSPVDPRGGLLDGRAALLCPLTAASDVCADVQFDVLTAQPERF